MSSLTSVLDTKAGLMLTALVVTWVCVALLGIVVANLQVRLRRLEQTGGTRRSPAAYGQLLGQQMSALLAPHALEPAPRVLLFVSESCGSPCTRLLSEVSSLRVPAAVASIDGFPSSLPSLPDNVSVLKEGPAIAPRLGIGVTPFVVVASDAGTIIKASPANSLESVAQLVDQSLDPQLVASNGNTTTGKGV